MSHFYKNIKKTEFKVGIFVTISFIMLFFSYSWLNDWFISSKNDIIKVQFDNANNLDKGSSVYYRGVRIGRVSSISIENYGVIISLSVTKNIFIANDSNFVIKDKDMLGSKIVDITPGISTSTLNPDLLYFGTSSSGLSSLISRLIQLADKFEVMLQQIPLNDGLFERIEGIISNTENTMSGMEFFVNNLNNQDLFVLITEMKSVLSSFDGFINETNTNMLDTFTRLNNLLVNSNHIVDIMKANIENEDSNINKIFNDKELYENLVNSTKQLEALIIDVKENPRKYFRVSVF